MRLGAGQPGATLAAYCETGCRALKPTCCLRTSGRRKNGVSVPPINLFERNAPLPRLSDILFSNKRSMVEIPPVQAPANSEASLP